MPGIDRWVAAKVGGLVTRRLGSMLGSIAGKLPSLDPPGHSCSSTTQQN